jgi:protoporphyrinogen/coproporphyrinogen III oxidase
MSSRRVVVAGGGITGLSVAHRLLKKRPDLTVTLLESRERLGGNIVTERRDGFVLDGGPDSFLRTKPEAVALAKELGLGPELISPRAEARKVYIAHRGRLEPMPGGMALAVPTRLGPMLTTPILSPLAKLRMLGDLALPRSPPRDDESIEAFVARRFGAQAARRIAAPLLGGIYAGDVAELSVDATFPMLVDLERRHRSLILGLFAAELARRGAAPERAGRLRRGVELVRWLKREAEQAPSPFYSLRSGMGSLIDALAAGLPPGATRVGDGARSVESVGSGWSVLTESGERLAAEAVVLATPAHVAARLVGNGELAAELRAIPYVSTATAFFALDRRGVAHALDGVGFIVPPGQARILAGTWVSSKWEGRAPEGAALIRAFLGGARSRGSIDVCAESDARLTDVARAELERLMGPLGAPLFTRVFRYERANPQPVVGHRARLERLRRRLDSERGLHLAGAPYDGVGIPDCVRQAERAAEAVLEELA